MASSGPGDGYHVEQLSWLDQVADLRPTEARLHDDLTYEQCLDALRAASEVNEASQWWIGDMINQATDRYEHGKYDDFVDATGRSKKTLKEYARVSKRLKSSTRVDDLGWSLHREVSDDELTEDDQSYLLGLALNGTEDYDGEPPMSCREFKSEVDDYKKRKAADEVADKAEDAEAHIGIRVEASDCFELIDGLDNKSVDLLLTDPPYNVTDNKWDQWEDDDEYDRFMRRWLTVLRPKMADEFNAFVFCDADYSPRLYQLLQETGWPVQRQVIWYRPNLAKKRSRGKTFHSAYEPFWHVGNRGLTWPEDWGDERFDVQKFAVPQSNHKEDRSYHPTQKPLALFERLVMLATDAGDLVVDPFCGVGTAPLACLRRERRAVAGDLSERFVEIARGRLAQERDEQESEAAA